MHANDCVIGKEYSIKSYVESDHGAFRFDVKDRVWRGYKKSEEYPTKIKYIANTEGMFYGVGFFVDVTPGHYYEVLRVSYRSVREEPSLSMKVWRDGKWVTTEVTELGDSLSIAEGSIETRHLQDIANKYFRESHIGYTLSSEASLEHIDIGCVRVEAQSLRQLCIDKDCEMGRLRHD